MRFDVVTLFPDWIAQAIQVGLVGQAFERGLLSLATHNPRDFALGAYRRVDDRPFGGGPGMVMQIEPLRAAIEAARNADPRSALVVLLSPQGRLYQQRIARRWADSVQRLILVAGRYEGLDERLVAALIDEEWSIGDYVLSGGEPAALVVIDSVARLVPGVLGSAESAITDSFASDLLDWPHYAHPVQHEYGEVPPVLRSGHHRDIAAARRAWALERTWRRRPELLARLQLTEADRATLAGLAKAELASGPKRSQRGRT